VWLSRNCKIACLRYAPHAPDHSVIADLTALGGARLLETDICIIGSGAAGLTLAAEFLDAPQRVLVLESGRTQPEALDSELNEVRSTGLRHDGAREGRVRAFGGTTRVWGGQLLPLRPSELAARAWVPYSGWPIELESLQPFYRRAELLLGIEGPPFDAAVWQRLRVAAPPLDPERLCFRFSQWAPLGRRNFAVMLRSRLAASRNVTVVLDATATALRCNPAGARVQTVEVQSRHGQRLSVKAAAFVVACGGIETARLLLASPGPEGRGVGNASDRVGRFFQDHISYVGAEIQPRSRAQLQQLFDPRYLGRTMFTVKMEATERWQRERGLLNVMAHLAFQIPEALGLLEVRRILRALQAGRVSLPSLDEVVALVHGSGELMRLVLRRVLEQRRASPRRGSVLLLIDTEQAPNPESRVTLDASADAFGMRKAVLDWRLTGLETKTLQEFGQMIAGEFERLGLASVALAGPPDFNRRDALGSARDIFHHMGTARMSHSPRDGVTNPDLRCHSVDNLFIAGAAVFPAGGISNPTFTAIALSIRLADHLKQLRRLS
jgi:choline dehydrogenase-like flavoprotein